MNSPQSDPGASRPVQPVALESQAERRRAQLLQVAAKLVEAEGIEAVQMSRVAELAGCTRALVHRYFPKREDLLCSVLQGLNAKLEAMVQTVGEPDGGDLDAWSKQMTEAVWDLLDDGGLAGVILISFPHVNPTLNAYVTNLRAALLDKWIGAVRPLVADEDDAEFLVDLWISLVHRVALKRQSGVLDRDEAIKLHLRLGARVLSGFSKEVRK